MSFGTHVSRAVRPLLFHLASLASLRLIFEVLIVEELLFSRREDELLTTFDTLYRTILKLFHRLLLPNPGDAWGFIYSTSRLVFLRLRLRAKACLPRFFSPGLR